MKKMIFTLLLVLSAVCIATAQVQADLTIYKGTDITEINGLEDDEVWSKVTAVPITNKFNYEQATVDGSYFKMFYTDEYIYVLVDVTDDVHYPAWIAEDTKNEWLYDKVEIYFDVNDVLKDGNGPAYINGYMAAGHYQMAPFLKEDHYAIPHEPENVIYGSLSGQVTMCYTLKADMSGYTMEYRFPLYAFVNDKEDELTVEAFKALPQGLGFDVLIVDNDNDGAGRKRAVWKNMGPDEPYSNMDNCGVVVLSNEEVGMGINTETILTNQLRVYPNPVKDILTIGGDADEIILFNITGQKMKAFKGNNPINVSNLPNGIYFIKAYQNGEYTGTSKIIKE